MTEQASAIYSRSVKMSRYLDKIQTFIEMGKLLSRLSTCKRDKVSAIVFPCDCTAIYSIGYNGPAQGLLNDSCTDEEGQCGCVHAEANAIIKLGNQTKPCVLYSTRMPCRTCAGLILNCSQIKAVIYAANYRNLFGYNLIKKAGGIIEYFENIRNIEQDLLYWKKRC